MVSEISEETEIQAPAAKVWDLYGTLELAKFIPLHLSNHIQKVDVLEGDGGEGTILHVTFAPQLGGGSYKEKFVTVDDKKRIKIVEMVEGGYLDLGFTLYRIHFEIIEKMNEEESCIVKYTVEYELKEATAANISLARDSVQPMIVLGQAANNYFLNNDTQRPKDA